MAVISEDFDQPPGRSGSAWNWTLLCFADVLDKGCSRSSRAPTRFKLPACKRRPEVQRLAALSQVEKLQTQVRSMKRAASKAELDEDAEAKIDEAKVSKDVSSALS